MSYQGVQISTSFSSDGALTVSVRRGSRQFHGILAPAWFADASGPAIGELVAVEIQECLYRIDRLEKNEGVLKGVVKRVFTSGQRTLVEIDRDQHHVGNFEIGDAPEIVRWSMAGSSRVGNIEYVNSRDFSNNTISVANPSVPLMPGDRLYLEGCAPKPDIW